MSLEQIKSGLKLIDSAERGITSDGKRIVSAKTAELFVEVGEREIVEGIKDIAMNTPELLANFMVFIRQGEEGAESTNYYMGRIEVIEVQDSKLTSIKLIEYPEFIPYHPAITIVRPLLEEQKTPTKF